MKTFVRNEIVQKNSKSINDNISHLRKIKSFFRDIIQSIVFKRKS